MSKELYSPAALIHPSSGHMPESWQTVRGPNKGAVADLVLVLSRGRAAVTAEYRCLVELLPETAARAESNFLRFGTEPDEYFVLDRAFPLIVGSDLWELRRGESPSFEIVANSVLPFAFCLPKGEPHERVCRTAKVLLLRGAAQHGWELVPTSPNVA